LLRVHPIAGVLLIAVLLGTIFFLSLPGTTLWQRVVQDAGHGPVFAGIAILLLLMRAPPAGASVRAPSDYLRVLFWATALGILTELVQLSMPNRDVSFMDAMHDAAGAALGLAVVWIIEHRRSLARADETHIRTVAAAGLLAFTILAWQPLQAARAYAERAAAFPAIIPAGSRADAEFAVAHESTLEYTQLPGRWRQPGDGNSIRLEFKRGARPGLQVVEPRPDWRGYDVLAFDVTNPAAEPAWFMLRVLDAQHDWSHQDRFNQPVLVPALTRTTIRISIDELASAPRNRRMDLAAISDVMIFALQPPAAEEFFVSRIWLE
jgi:hypothetical protein